MHELMDYSEYKTRFSCLYREASFYLKYIRSLELSNFERIVTDLQSVYEELYPIYGDKVELYSDDSYSLDKLLGISTKLLKANEKKVWLKSGGNLVIEPTEALTVIDVNTGKAVDGRRKKETTFYKINCEAAIEAARQIRMRNLSGIILIDFIDMKEQEHVEELMQLLRMKLSEDKVKTVLVDITKLGLVEITRMKKNPPLLKPATVTLGVLYFLWCWNDFVFPNIMLGKEELRTITMNLYVFRSSTNTEWDLFIAGLTVSLIPIVIIYILAQKHITSGLTAGAVK